jgi:hypothetical protein
MKKDISLNINYVLEDFSNKKQNEMIGDFSRSDVSEGDLSGDQIAEDKNYQLGLITRPILKTRLPSPSKDILIMLCGSKVMTREYLLPILLDLDYSKQSILIF